MTSTQWYIVLILGWALYFFIHSVLAASSVKEVLSNKAGLSLQVQRLIYNFIATLGLLALLLVNGLINSDNLLPAFSWLKIASLFLAGAGFFVVKLSFRNYSMKSFMGFEKEVSQELSITGIHTYMRHPLYTGTILIMIAFFLFDSRAPSLVTTICVLLYLPFGIYLEERKLIRVFGDQYLAYKKEVPALIPRFRS